MCGTVVQWSRICLQGQMNRVLLPATLISVNLCCSFFFLFIFFFNTQSFSLAFLYSYCPPCWSRTFINVYFKLKLGEFCFKSSWSAYWPSLRPEKNISCQDMSLLWNSWIFFSMLVDVMTNNTQYTSTEVIYTQHPLVTHRRKLNLPFVHRLNHQYYYPRIPTVFAPPKLIKRNILLLFGIHYRITDVCPIQY